MPNGAMFIHDIHSASRLKNDRGLNLLFPAPAIGFLPLLFAVRLIALFAIRDPFHHLRKNLVDGLSRRVNHNRIIRRLQRRLRTR